MSHPRWFHLLLAALALQLCPVSTLWAQGELSFTRQDFEAGGTPFSVIVGDFDNDGRQDLVTANDPGVSSLLGNGDGTFEPPRQFSAAGGNTSVTASDFNGDGWQDLGAGNGFAGVTIHLGQGDGTFQWDNNLVLTGGSTQSIATGDFNGDGRQDLVTADTREDDPSGLSVLLGLGDGTFEFLPIVMPLPGAPSGRVGVVVGEFNGDGQQDLAAVNGGLDFIVSIFLGNGNGRFHQPQTFVVGDGAAAITMGDFNGDGIQDLATANPNTVSILLGNGDGTFQSAQDFALEECPEGEQTALSITVGEFNGDSEQDLATANFTTGTVSILLGNGDGTFAPGQIFGVGPGPRSVTAGDFNGDGAQDVATANSGGTTVTILIDNASAVPSPTAPPPPSPSSPQPSDSGGGGAVDLLSLLFLILGLSSVGWHTARSRIVRLSR